MTGSSGKSDIVVVNEDERGAASAAPIAARRPYRAPKLRHLGSVRELTLGSTMGKNEGGGTFKLGM